MAIIVVIWIALILANMKKTIEEVPFNIDNTVSLRGICAIEIMLGHLGIATGSAVLFPNRKAGILFVGVFFALSGYGLMDGVVRKKNYLSNFLSKRLQKILIPAYIVFLTDIMLHSVLEQNAELLQKAIDLKEFFSRTNWYVWEQCVMYILFFVCAKIDKSFKRSFYILACISLCFICCAFAMNLDNPWYGSTMCFNLGILLYIKNDIWVNICKCHWMKKVVVCIVLLLLSIAVFFYCSGIIANLIARNVASLLFVIIVFIFLQKFCIGNPVTIWCGRHSYEIYLFHLIIIGHLRPYISNDVLYAYCVVALTFFTSFLYGKCANWVRRLCMLIK